jgi:uncharacterized metal-binding protein YceD (DUF177 family)
MNDSILDLTVHVARLPAKGFTLRHRASAHECGALAAAHGLLAVRSFAVDAVVTRWRGEGVKIAGRVRADLDQECVVSLEPVPVQLDVPVEATFLPDGSRLLRPRLDRTEEIIVDIDAADAPDSFSGDTINFGATIEEFLELALDPYPRSPQADLSAETPGEARHSGGQPSGEGRENPFAALASLQKPSEPDE